MNKKFLSAILFGALMVTSTGTFVSCKDYDDDIDAVQEQVDSNASTISTLASQLSALQTALTTAQSTADAAKTAAATAQATGNDALAAAEEAKAAAAQAKADAIAEAIKEVNVLKTWVEAQDYVTTEELAVALATVAGKIEGIENDMSEIRTYIEETLTTADQSALMRIIALEKDMEIQKDALAKLEDALQNSATNEALAAKIADVKKSVEELVNELDSKIGQTSLTLSTFMQDYDTAMAELIEYNNVQDANLNELSKAISALSEDAATKAELDELWAEINGEGANSVRTQLGSLASTITAIQADIHTLHVLVSARLTSVAFVPQQYLDGVETILFKSLEYTNNGKTYYLTNNDRTTAVYHMNPIGANINSIIKDEVAFVANKASNITRATTEECPVVVTGVAADVDRTGYKSNNDLVVSLKKTEAYVNQSFGISNENFWIVSLKLPIHKDYWAEGEENPVVYSEYVRLAETSATPVLAKTNDVATDEYRHLYEKEALYKSKPKELVYITEIYTKEIDLTEYVKVCELLDGTHADIDWESYGLKIQYSIASDEYLQGTLETNQQQFAYFVDEENTTLASCVYDDGEFYAKNPAAIDREPIIRVDLVDTNHDNNIVETKYLKIKWAKSEPVDLGTIKNWPLLGLKCENEPLELETKEMNQLIYANENVEMASVTFHSIYTNAGLTNTGIGTVNVVADVLNGVTSYNLKWTISDEDYVANQGKTVIAECTWEAIDGSGDITFKLTAYVPQVSFGLIENSYNSSYWTDNTWSTFKVAPIAYGNTEAERTVVYKLSLVNNGFSYNNAPCSDLTKIIEKTNFTGVLYDAQIIFDLDKCQTEEYYKQWGLTNKNQVKVSDNGKELYLNNSLAASISDDVKNTFTLNKTEAGISLIGTSISEVTKVVPVKIFVESCVLDQTVKQYDLAILKPLEINDASEGLFYESKNEGSNVNVADALTLTDFNKGNGKSGYIVADKDYDETYGEKYQYAQKLYTYYGVGTPEWDIEHAYTNLVGPNMTPGTVSEDNKGVLPDGVALTQNGDVITYKSQGQRLGVEYIIYIPVSVKYKWGTLTKDVKFTVKPGSGIE